MKTFFFPLEFSASALMTAPRAESDLLMLAPSLSLSPYIIKRCPLRVNPVKKVGSPNALGLTLNLITV